jgi:polysaccharide transporter, PST family
VPAPDPIMSHIEAAALKRRTVHGGVATFIAQGCRILLRLASQIFIARLLVPADYGLVAMVYPILALLQLVGELGLGQVAVVHRDISSAEVSTLFWLGLLTNTALAMLLALASPLIAELYHEPRLVAVTLILAALLPVASLTTQHIALLNRDMRFGALAVLDFVPPALGLATGITAARFGWGYWSLIGVAIAETFGTLVVTWSFSRWWPSLPSYSARIWSLVRFGTHITVYNLANYVTVSVDHILLGATQGAIALGLYDRGYKLVVQPLLQLTAPISRVAVPLLSRLGPTDVRYRRAYLDMVSAMLLIGTPGILVGMVTAKTLVVFLLGRQWEAVAPIFAWFCFGGLASPIYSSTFWLFVTQGRTSQQTYYVTVTSVISVLCFIAGLPWGAVGVSAGAALSFVFLTTPLVCWGATRTDAVKLSDLAGALLPFVIAALATAGVLEVAASHLPPIGAALRIGLCLPLAYATFLTALLCLPGGNPVVRKAWQIGMMLIRTRRGLASGV